MAATKRDYRFNFRGMEEAEALDTAKSMAMESACREFDYATHEAFVVAVDWRGSIARCHVAVWDL